MRLKDMLPAGARLTAEERQKLRDNLDQLPELAFCLFYRNEM